MPIAGRPSLHAGMLNTSLHNYKPDVPDMLEKGSFRYWAMAASIRRALAASIALFALAPICTQAATPITRSKKDTFAKFEQIMKKANPGYKCKCNYKTSVHSESFKSGGKVKTGNFVSPHIIHTSINTLKPAASLVGRYISFDSCTSPDWSQIGWEQLTLLKIINFQYCNDLKDLSFLAKIPSKIERLYFVSCNNIHAGTLKNVETDLLSIDSETIKNLDFITPDLKVSELALEIKNPKCDTSGLKNIPLSLKELSLYGPCFRSIDFINDKMQLADLKLQNGIEDLTPILKLHHLERLRIGIKIFANSKLEEWKENLKKELCQKEDKTKKAIEEKQKAIEEKQKAAEEKQSLAAIKSELKLDMDACLQCLATIKTSSHAAGSGFIAKDSSGNLYLYTNQHVVSGCDKFTAKTLDNHKLRLGPLEVSATRDIIRFALPAKGGVNKALDLADTISPQDPVAVLGNSGGAGVATTLYGRVLGVGPDRIEVSAKFIPGNSGSPVITRDGKVAGIATYMTLQSNKSDWTVKGTRFCKTRRFAYKTTNIKWIPMKWDLYRKLTQQISADKKSLDDIFNLAVKWVRTPYKPIGANSSEMDVKSWIAAHNKIMDKINRGVSRAIPESKRKALNKMARAQTTKSYKKLSGICKRRATKIRARMRGMDNVLTPFLKSTMEENAQLFDVLAKEIEEYGRKLTSKDAVVWEKKEDPYNPAR